MDIRWKQRFQNFEKSLHLLTQALNIEEPDIIEKAGLIQFFEMTFELAWNTMKDYLQEEGFDGINTPRAAIKKAFEADLIKDGQLWLQLLQDRNLTSHAYDEEKADIIHNLIAEKYYSLLNSLHSTLKQKLHEQ